MELASAVWKCPAAAEAGLAVRMRSRVVSSPRSLAYSMCFSEHHGQLFAPYGR
jgi:hypothetical protein